MLEKLSLGATIILGVAGLVLFLCSRMVRKGMIREIREGSKFKAVLLVRDDLGMSKGKVLAQAMHAAYTLGRRGRGLVYRAWEIQGQKKVVLRVSEEEMKRRVAECRREGINVVEIKDAGHTQVEPGSWTVSLVGPEDEEKLNKITGDLKLY